jgi:hypothetical protein
MKNAKKSLEMLPQVRRMAVGGLADMDQYIAADAADDEEEPGINTDPMGSAQEMMRQFLQSHREQTPKPRAARPSMGRTGGADMPKEMGADKGMQMSYDSLSSARDLVPELKSQDSARSQMEALALAYKLRMQEASDRSKGFGQSTLSAPTLDKPTLVRDKLTKKRFKDGGEVKKASAEEPGIFGVKEYATQASQRMFPDQMGQDDQRDAARHMLAAAAVARKYGPEAAKMLGMAHEYMSNPKTFFSGLGIGQPRDDLPYDEHNNLVGAELAARATSREQLEALVQALARKATTKQTPGKPWIMGQEQLEARAAKAEKGMTPPPEYRAGGSPEEGEMSDPEAALFAGRGDVPAAGQPRPRVLDEILGAGETALTLGTSAAASLAGMPYGLYKGLTSGKYLEGKAADIASKEAAAFIERNTYQPRTESGQENLAALAKIADRMKLAPTPGGAAIASLARPTAVNAQVERLGMAAEKSLEGPVTRTLERGGKAADLLRSFETQPSRAVRPTGSTMLTGPVAGKKRVGEVDKIVDRGVYDAGAVAGRDEDKKALLENFWNKKARNYFERQFGTPDDPVLEGIKSGKIKGTSLSSDLRTGFPSYLMDALKPGKTRIKEGNRADTEFMGPGAPETRFFPEYPEAYEEVTRRYDEGTGLQSSVTLMDPAAADPQYTMLSSAGRDMVSRATEKETDKMLGQGMRPELINPKVGGTARSIVSPDRVINTGGTSAAKELFEAYEEASAFAKMTPEQQREFVQAQGMGDIGDEGMGQSFMADNVRTAIEKGEPVYDIGYMSKPVRSLFNTEQINQYLSGLPAREVANIRFEDAVRGGVKVGENKFRFENLINRIKEGKPVDDKVFSDGVGKPLVQFKEGPLEGFAWKRIEKREATVPEGAYVGHSVGGYEMGGATYTSDKREGFKTGKWQVYTLRDNRNRPVNTIEVRMDDENTPVVTQIKGNGRATGNAAPEKYDSAVLEFLEKHLKPAKVQEDDRFLTPLLQNYKRNLSDVTAQEKERALYRELGLE